MGRGLRARYRRRMHNQEALPIRERELRPMRLIQQRRVPALRTPRKRDTRHRISQGSAKCHHLEMTDSI